MKKLLPLIAVFAFAVFQTACKKALPDIDFTREYGNIEFTILPKDSVGEFSLIDKVITHTVESASVPPKSLHHAPQEIPPYR